MSDSRAHARPRGRVLATAAAVLIAAGGALEPVYAAKKKAPEIPYSVKVELFWGAKKNREAYRSELEHAVIQVLLDRACFASVVQNGASDLVLQVQVNDLITEQDYWTNDAMMPGQGEEHELRSALASVNLDFALKPARSETIELTNGHIFREIRREPVSPMDPVEQRALHDLTLDASRWIGREVCGKSGRIVQRAAEALAPASKPAQ